jgi:hypothetical protein
MLNLERSQKFETCGTKFEAACQDEMLEMLLELRQTWIWVVTLKGGPK